MQSLFSYQKSTPWVKKPMSTCVTHYSTIICSIFIAELNMTYIAHYKFKLAALMIELTKSLIAEKLIPKVGTHSYLKIMVC